MFVRIVITFLLLAFYVKGTCQTAPTIKSVTLPSPGASSLGKFGENPVSLYTGIPQINVPLYTISAGDLQLPIGLSYHAGGIKVEEIASQVGLGWSLNIGGVITRSIRGLADKYNLMNYYDQVLRPLAQAYAFGNNARSPLDAGNAQQADMSTIMPIAKGQEDGEPDVYYFNFGNYSGSFFLGPNQQFIISPKQGIKIEKFTKSQYSNDDVGQWILTTPDGVRYVFGVSLTDDNRAGIEKNNTDSRTPVTSWYLMDIISPNGEQINLSYTMMNYTYTTRAGQTLNKNIGTPQTLGTIVNLNAQESKTMTNIISEPRISQITFALGKVVVTSTTDRSDLPGCKTVDEIAVYNNESASRPIKKFKFLYNYSVGSRLVLQSVEEQTSFNTSIGGKYQFGYNTAVPAMPQRLINSNNINGQDLWGYFNGVASNAMLPPSYSILINGVTTNVAGADRHSDATAMKAGVLTSITYPTGGTTEFEYEANTVWSNRTYDGIPEIPESKGVSLNYGTGETKQVDFSITNAEFGVAKVQINSHSQLEGCPLHPISNISVCNNAYVVGINGTNYSARSIPEGSISFDLPNGNYRLVGEGVDIPGAPQPNSFYVSLDWYEFPQVTQSSPTNKTIGGLRILRIKNTDGDGNVLSLKKYQYNQFVDTTKSSGVLVNWPAPLIAYYYTVGYEVRDPPDHDRYFKNLYAQVKSSPLVPLNPTGGAVIGYENVTELEGENGENGKTEYTFTTAKDSRDFFNYYRPYPSPISYEFRRGKVKLKTVYKNSFGNFVPVQTVYTNYKIGLNGETGYGVAAQEQNATLSESPNAYYIPSTYEYYVSGTELISEFLHLSSEVTRDYNPVNPAEYIETIKEYEHDTQKGHYLLTKTTTKNSRGEEIESVMKYPQDTDLALTGSAETGRTNLVSKHIWSPVLREIVNNNGALTAQTNTNYNLFASGLVLPESIETKIGTSPLDKRVEFLKYDIDGNILQQHKSKDLINFIIWDYKNTYPIAEVVNASETRIDSMAYTSFEAEGKGNWLFTGTPIADASSPTGKKCYYLGSANITKTALSTTTTYIVSYWKKNGTVSVNGTTSITGRSVRGWTYYEHQVVNPVGGLITVSGSGALIDELRLYPKDASMTTYTYKPLVGISSQCDANNRITYYEYDLFNRLYVVRDQDYNVLKRLHYTYGSTENTSLVFNDAQTGTYISNCGTACLIPSAEMYTVPANTYLGPDKAAANLLAQEDVIANGQNYANTFATCTTPGTTSMLGSNGMTVGFTVQFQNRNSNCSPLTYTFTVNAGASSVNLGSMKEGNYDVTFSAGTDPFGYTYRVNGLSIHSVGGTIYDVPIRSSATNQVIISP